jgi:formylglycine-generating enzyme required for sulfatase activity
MTCVDTENVRVPLSPIELDADLTMPSTSAQGSFGKTDPCAPSEQTSTDVICVPGGAFLFGGPDGNPDGIDIYSSVPQRTAVMPKLFVDKLEVSVAKMRTAIASGLPVDSAAIFVNDGPLWSSGMDPPQNACAYTSEPKNREALGANCVSWRLARAYCQMRGGDLPTEAEWEYIASVAGRPFKTLYAWGNDEATCSRAAYGRTGDASGAGADCSKSVNANPGPVPVTSDSGSNGHAGDVTPEGIVGLMGGLSEWTLDSAAPFDGACWSAATLASPRCWEQNATHRAVRGSSWADGVIVPSTVRIIVPGEQGGAGIPNAAPPDFAVGFRCVYAGAPK